MKIIYKKQTMCVIFIAFLMSWSSREPQLLVHDLDLKQKKKKKHYEAIDF